MKPIVDISFWQDPPLINYDEFADGISGAILRGAYGIWKDTRFDKHYDELHKRGVPLGSYHYIIGKYTGTAQADIFNQVTHGKELKLGLWNDVEDRGVSTGLTKSVVNEYHSTIEILSKRKVGIYTGAYSWNEIMQADRLKYSDRPLWIASYTDQTYMESNITKLTGWKSWLMWQYTYKGRINGYPSDIDCNHFNGTEEDYKKYFNLNVIIPTPPPVTPPTTGVVLPKLKVIRNVNVRSQPNTSASVLGVHATGDIVNVLEIKPISAVSVWVRTDKGWSVVVHYGAKYMEGV